MAKKILDEMNCYNCGKKLSLNQPLFETAWLGVYWCGAGKCAAEIMEGNCEECNPEDDCYYED